MTTLIVVAQNRKDYDYSPLILLIRESIPKVTLYMTLQPPNTALWSAIPRPKRNVLVFVFGMGETGSWERKLTRAGVGTGGGGAVDDLDL